MRSIDVVLIGAYTLISTAAIILIKQYAGPALDAWKQAPSWSTPMGLVLAGGLLYAMSFLIWMAVLSRNQLSVVYPIAIGLTLVSTGLAAWLLFGEAMTLWRIVGIAVIFIGIVLVTSS